jgi:ABC-2 type transport system permease protein
VKIIDIALKDMLQSFRSVFMVGMTIVAPLFVTGMLYLAFSGSGSGKYDLPPVVVGIVNQDQPVENQPALGKTIVSMFTDPSVSSWLKPVEINDEATARQSVDRQEIGVAVIIPKDFSRIVFSGKGSTSLVLVQDPTLSIGPTVIRNMLGSLLDGIDGANVTAKIVNEHASSQGKTLDPNVLGTALTSFQSWYTTFQRTLYHSSDAAIVLHAPGKAPDTGTQGNMQQILAFVLAGQMIFFCFYTGAYAMMSVLNEDEHGTLARMFTTPTDRTAILTGKFLAVVVTVTIQSLVLVTIGRFLFQVYWGNPLNVALIILGQVMAASGLGVFLISLVKTTRQAGPVLGGALTMMGMMGGLFTVGFKMPDSFNTVTLFTPHGWVVQGWKLAMTDSPVSAMVLPVSVCVVIGTLLFVAGALIFRRRYA